MGRGGYRITNQQGIHFVTFTTVGWVDVFTRKECKDIIIEALKYSIANRGLLIYAYVVMSNHLHLAIAAAKNSKGLSAFIRDFKKFTSKEILKWLKTSHKESRRAWMLPIFRDFGRANIRNKHYQVWQQHNHPIELKYSSWVTQKVNYIHNNPVKAAIVDRPEDYLYSSARNYAGRKDYILEVELIASLCP